MPVKSFPATESAAAKRKRAKYCQKTPAAFARRALASHIFYLKILWFYPPRRENAFRRRAFPGSSDLPDFPAKRAAKESQKRHSFRIFALRRADFQTSRFESRR